MLTLGHLLLFAAMLSFWVVFLAGIAATENACVSNYGKFGASAFGRHRRLLTTDVEECGNQLSEQCG